MGFPRWIRANPETDSQQQRCYRAVLDRLVCAANAETRKCATCSIADGCRVWAEPDK